MESAPDASHEKLQKLNKFLSETKGVIEIMEEHTESPNANISRINSLRRSMSEADFQPQRQQSLRQSIDLASHNSRLNSKQNNPTREAQEVLPNEKLMGNANRSPRYAEPISRSRQSIDLTSRDSRKSVQFQPQNQGDVVKTLAIQMKTKLAVLDKNALENSNIHQKIENLRKGLEKVERSASDASSEKLEKLKEFLGRSKCMIEALQVSASKSVSPSKMVEKEISKEEMYAKKVSAKLLRLENRLTSISNKLENSSSPMKERFTPKVEKLKNGLQQKQKDVAANRTNLEKLQKVEAFSGQILPVVDMLEQASEKL